MADSLSANDKARASLGLFDGGLEAGACWGAVLRSIPFGHLRDKLPNPALLLPFLHLVAIHNVCFPLFPLSLFEVSSTSARSVYMLHVNS